MPQAALKRQYDVVMVAAWWRMKRHRVLFRALAKLKPRNLRTALIGYPMDMTVEDIRRQMRAHGIEDQCDVFESISPERVAQIVADAKVAVLLSKQEGNAKAPYEALFCDTPVILYRHNLGIRTTTINEQTGLLADDDELPEAIQYVIDHPQQFHPRDWALANSGYRNSTNVVNAALKELAVNRREPWTKDIVPKVNRPNLRYKHETDRITMEPAYDEFRTYIYDI